MEEHKEEQQAPELWGIHPKAGKTKLTPKLGGDGQWYLLTEEAQWYLEVSQYTFYKLIRQLEEEKDLAAKGESLGISFTGNKVWFSLSILGQVKVERDRPKPRPKRNRRPRTNE